MMLTTSLRTNDNFEDCHQKVIILTICSDDSFDAINMSAAAGEERVQSAAGREQFSSRTDETEEIQWMDDRHQHRRITACHCSLIRTGFHTGLTRNRNHP